jgi:hypothetical protein
VLKRRSFDIGSTASRPFATSVGRTGEMRETKVGRITLRSMTSPTAGESTVTDTETVEETLNALKVDELKDIAAAEGVEITSEMKKADIVAAIAAKRRATSPEFTQPAQS